MRARSIYEKFVQDSDPIKDMGIGMQQKVEKYKRNILNRKGSMAISSRREDSDTLAWAAYENEFQIATYLADIVYSKKIVYDNSLRDPLSYAAVSGNTKMGLLLIDHGADLEKSMKYAQKYCNQETITGLFIIERALRNRKKVEEKFTEEGDPIHQMGIGIEHIREFKTLKEAAKNYVDNINILSKGVFKSKEDLQHYLKEYELGTSYSSRSLLRCCKEYLEGYYGEFKGLTIKNLYNIPFTECGSKLDFLKKFRDEVMKYAKRRLIREKFEENSDPIYDMGIGLTQKLKNIVEKIFDLDLKQSSKIKSWESGNINAIRIYKNQFWICFYNDEYNENGKYFSKKKYCQFLFESLGILQLFEKKIKRNKTPYFMCFTIKDEFVKYFPNGYYDEMNYEDGSKFYKYKINKNMDITYN